LEPAPPSPSTYAGLSSVPTLGKRETDENKAASDGNKKDEAKTETQEERSAAARASDLERERAVATPTDFALDFGKGLRPTGSFDASNGKDALLKSALCCAAIENYVSPESILVYVCLPFSAGMASVSNCKRSLFSWWWFWFWICFEHTSSCHRASYAADTKHDHVFLLFGCGELAAK